MRRPPPADGLRSTRKSRTFYATSPALQERMRVTSPEGFYTFMLYEDLDHVVPYSIGRGGQEARVTGPDAEKAQPLVERALSGQDWTPSLSDSVRKFVSSTAQCVVIGGAVTYEIDYLYPLAGTSGTPTELFQDSFLAPYGVWRQLRFLEFKIKLRNLIMEHLNASLAEIGSTMGFQASIELTGLPTLEDVENAKNDLQTGRRSLTDLVKFTI